MPEEQNNSNNPDEDQDNGLIKKYTTIEQLMMNNLELDTSKEYVVIIQREDYTFSF